MREKNEGRRTFLQWKYHTTYTIAILSWTMGLTNIFHSPGLILETGFFNFLGAHIIAMTTLGIPLTLIEIAVSQYSSKSLVQCWDICPFFRGVGYGKIIFITIFQVYYNVLNSYLLFYCFSSIPKYQNLSKCEPLTNGNDSEINVQYSTDAEKFWYSEVVECDQQLDYLGFPNWKLISCLSGHMALVFLFNLQGTKSLESVLPFFFGLSTLQFGILSLVTNAVPGAWNGTRNFFSTGFNVNNLLLWKKEQIITRIFQYYLYSMGLAFGGFSSIAAQGPFRKQIYRTSIWVNLVNLATSISYGLLFSNFHGIISHYSGNSIKLLQTNGAEMDYYHIFTVIPNGLKYLPGIPQVWQFVFYSSIYIRGLCTASLMASTVLNAIYEETPKLSNYTGCCSLAFCIIIYSVGCLLHTNYGPIAGRLIKYIASGVILPVLTTFQAISVVVLYGLLRFMEDLHFMLGSVPTVYWPVCLVVTVCMTPLLAIKTVVNYFQNAELSVFEVIAEKFILSVVLVWIPFMGMVRTIRKKKWSTIMGTSTNWVLPNDMEKSRLLFEEQNCVQEFLYEKHLIEDKLKKYV